MNTGSWRLGDAVTFLLVVGAVMMTITSSAGAPGRTTIGDAKLKLTLDLANGGLVETFQVFDSALTGLAASPWVLETDAGKIVPKDTALDVGKSKPAGEAASFTGTTSELDWKLEYRLIAPGLITKTLSITPKRDLVLKQVSMWNGSSAELPVVASTSLQDIAAFYRQDGRGMFVSLDFPYSRIVTAGQETSVTYPPHDRLKAGQSYECHSITVGATELTGHARYGFDDGEVDAMDTYMQTRFPLRFDRPMFISACINNRYTQVTDKGVFYTMKDHPTLSFNQDLLKREIELMPKIGMEYYQLWTGPFDSVPGDPDPKFVHEAVKFARQRGVRIGDYSAVNGLFCYHYNEYSNSIDNHPEWGLKNSDVCLGNPKYTNFYRDMVVGNDKNYGFEIHCLDFMDIRVCNSTEHGHVPGPDSVYAQVRGIVDILEGLNGVSPNMLTESNAGNWAEFLPKIAWANHNLYLTDPFIASPWQGLNQTRILDDVRREQMVSLHYSRFMPYRSYTNCQYFFSSNSISPDIRNYQYGALSSIAVTPNLCLAEIRPWLDRLNPQHNAQVLAFYKKWTDFLKRNYSLWTKTYQVGDNPGMGSVEIYGHAKDDHGFVFLVNPNYWDKVVDVPLDSSLGFTGSGKVEIAELYPVERLRLTEYGPSVALGTRISVNVPAQTVVVLEAKPAPERIDKPRLYGVPGTIEANNGGYLIKTSGPQGTTERCAVLLPNASKSIASVEVRDYPKQPKRIWAPTPVKMVAASGNVTAMDITFRRDAAPTELRYWQVKPGGLADGTAAGWTTDIKDAASLRFPLFIDVKDETVQLPMWDAAADKAGLGLIADFCGAYVENAFYENQDTWIELKTGEAPGAPRATVKAVESPDESRPLPELAKSGDRSWWAQTSFHLPFMYTIGCEPFLDEHTLLVLPFVRQSRIGQVKAWINGQPLEVRKYLYPRNRSYSCFYADLVGTAAKGGENKLVVYFERQ